MKIKICLLGIFALVTLAVAAPRTWTFQTGVKVEGDYVSSGTTTVVINRGGTNFFLRISELSTNDQAYALKMQLAQRQVRLDAEALQMKKAGWIEVTSQFLENFPEKTEDATLWMDAEFEELDNTYSENPEVYLGFAVQDKNGDFFSKCVVDKEGGKNPLIGQISALKHGDKIRLIGRKSYLSLDDTFNGRWIFAIDKVEIIETAAEKNFIEQQDASAP